MPIPYNLQVNINVSKDFPTIYADNQMLKRALTNLVQNATHAMPNDGKHTLQTYPTDNAIFVSVSNTVDCIPIAV